MGMSAGLRSLAATFVPAGALAAPLLNPCWRLISLFGAPRQPGVSRLFPPWDRVLPDWSPVVTAGVLAGAAGWWRPFRGPAVGVATAHPNPPVFHGRGRHGSTSIGHSDRSSDLAGPSARRILSPATRFGPCRNLVGPAGDLSLRQAVPYFLLGLEQEPLHRAFDECCWPGISATEISLAGFLIHGPSVRIRTRTCEPKRPNAWASYGVERAWPCCAMASAVDGECLVRCSIPLRPWLGATARIDFRRLCWSSRRWRSPIADGHRAGGRRLKSSLGLGCATCQPRSRRRHRRPGAEERPARCAGLQQDGRPPGCGRGPERTAILKSC